MPNLGDPDDRMKKCAKVFNAIFTGFCCMDASCIGIDLGTMFTTAAASNGGRSCIRSEVGFARDAIAKHLIGEDVVIGELVNKHRQALSVVRPFERNSLKLAITEDQFRSIVNTEDQPSLTAASALVSHTVQSLGIPSESEMRCVVGIPAGASIYSQRLVLDLIEAVTPYVAVVSEPFAVGFGLGSEANSSIIIDIGAGTVDYCYYYGAFPSEQDQATLGYGGDHVDEELRRVILENYPEAKVSETAVRNIKERYGSVGETMKKAIVELPTRDGRSNKFDLTELVRETCVGFANKITNGLAKHISSIDNDDFFIDGAKILLAGGGSQLHGLDEYIGQALSIGERCEVSRIHDCKFAGAMGALELARSLPEDGWQFLSNFKPEVGRDAA